MIVRTMRESWWIAAIAGAVLAIAAVVVVSAATETATAQTAGQANFRVTAGQLRINQRISQAAVRRSNESLRLLDPIRDSGANDDAPGFGTARIANGAITQAKLGADVVSKQPLWAVVNPDGTLARGSGATAAGRAAGPNFGSGVYTVTFNRNITQCAFTVSTGASGTTPPTLSGEALAYTNPAASGQVVTVRTFASQADGNAGNDPGTLSSTNPSVDGDEEDRGFHLQVTC
jgi:hypothetical protein